MNHAWIGLILLAIAGENTMAANAGNPVPFSSVPAPRLWAINESESYLVVTARNWSKYYSTAPRNSDFAASIYVVASMGTQPNPGYRIRITQIVQEGERVVVTVERLRPDPGKIYAQMLVNPVAVAEVKRTDLQPHTAFEFAFVDPGGRSLANVKVEL